MMLSKSKIFLIFCLAFIAGVFIARIISYQLILVAAIVCVIVSTVGFRNKFALVLGLVGIVMLFGAVRFKTDFAQNDLAQFYGQKAHVTGLIVEEPDERSDKTYLTIGKLVVNQKPVQSKILVEVSRFPEYQYGQKLDFDVKVQEPKEYPDFSYKNYLSRFGIDAVAYRPKINLFHGNFGNPIKRTILQIKKKFIESVGKILPEPQNSFLGGLLLGAKHAIPQSLTDQFNRTGTSHIVAVSGYNITIIAAAIDWLLQFFGLRKRLSFVLAILAISIFVIMTGATASVIRAGIMGTLLLIALNIGRVNVITNSLAFTAVLMLVINPQILAFDVGFQLSFAALLGIVYIVPLIDRYFLWLPKILREYFLATLAAQIFALPILMFNFGQLSIVAIIVNILVLPAVPITMLFGFLTGIMALIWSSLALPFSAISWLLLTYIVKVIGFFSSLPFAAVSWHINSLAMAIYYLIMTIIIVLAYEREMTIKFFDKWRSKSKNFLSI